MDLKLFNTLKQEVEVLRPSDERQIRMYTCGPTVYDYVHIGNFRTFVFQDLLRRVIRLNGYPLKHVMNITDVDDKIIAAAQRDGLSLQEYTRRYEEAFLQDLKSLRIQQPEVMPRATEHIKEMVSLILKLKDKGFTYESDGSIYFRIGSFPEYGKLSRLDLQGHQTQGRIDNDEYSKENPRDFVLWKAKRPGEAYWDSPLGPGRPGWHIECSAMSMKHLGDSFDLHCGGVDLIFPHHENEIAQSEAATNKQFVKHWVHGEFLIVDGEKMSKSKGNFYTLRDLLSHGCHPLAVRLLLLSTHYRKQLNFTFEGVQQAQAAIQRVNDFLVRVREVPSRLPENSVLSQDTANAERAFRSGLNEDLNTSVALGALFELIRETNVLLDHGEVGALNRDSLLQLFAEANSVFDVFQVQEERLEDGEVFRLIEERNQARRRREFSRADELRDRLAQRGILLEDTKEGTRWKRVN